MDWKFTECTEMNSVLLMNALKYGTCIAKIAFCNLSWQIKIQRIAQNI